jgi:peptidoglycan/LPS O-acetylase OafA/YrhL
VVSASAIALLAAGGLVFDDFTVAPAYGPLVSGGLLRGTAGIVLGYLLYETFLFLRPRIDGARHGTLATVFETVVLALLVFSMSIDSPAWNLAPVPLSALLILQMATAPGRLSALFQTRLFSALGDISFGVYLLHVPLFATFVGMGILPPAGSGFTPAWLVYLVLLLAVSAASFRHLERPAQRALMRLFRSWSTTTATS